MFGSQQCFSAQLHSGDLGSLKGLVNLTSVDLYHCFEITGEELSSALL